MELLFAQNSPNMVLEFFFFFHVFDNLNFRPKVTILQRLQPLHGYSFVHFGDVVFFLILGVFWSHFFAQKKNSNLVLE